MEKERLQREEERKAAELLKKHNGVLQNSSMLNSSTKLNTTMTKDEPSVPNLPKAKSIHDIHPNL